MYYRRGGYMLCSEKIRICRIVKDCMTIEMYFNAEFNSFAWDFVETQWRDIGKEDSSWQKYLQKKTKER